MLYFAYPLQLSMEFVIYSIVGMLQIIHITSILSVLHILSVVNRSRKMKKMRAKLSLLCLTVFLNQSSYAADFGVKFSWCDYSAQFNLTNVPKGTQKLKFRMVDLDVPSFNHGGGTINYTNQKQIDCGVISASSGGYTPPSPPSGAHTYEWSVYALDKDEKEIGVAKTSRKFPE